jgi:hypothetical protein
MASASWQAGSEYYIYDHGINPSKTEAPSTWRQEYGAIRFAYSELGPGKIHVSRAACGHT